jgi:site-specific DNA recombinase
MRAVIYCRVSSAEQARNLSLDTQEKLCRDYCERNGWSVAAVFLDKGESAKTADRPEFQRALAYCRENQGQVTHFVIWKLDRYARNAHDNVVIGARLRAYGVTLRSATEPIDDSAIGKLMENVLAGIAQFDNDNRADRTRVGLKEAVSRGRFVWRPPLGYLPGMKHDAERAPLVRRAFELIANGSHGQNTVSTTLGLTNRDGRPLSKQSVKQMLRNPAYAGIIRVPSWGVEQKGTFEPIVSEETFYRTQAVLDRRAPKVARHSRNNPDFPLRRFVRCALHAKGLTGSWSKGHGGRYGYYRCSLSGCLNISKPDLENRFTDLLETLGLDPGLTTAFRNIVLASWEKAHADAKAIGQARQKQLEAIKRRKERLASKFVDDLIDENTYRSQLARIEDELALVVVDHHVEVMEEQELKGLLDFAEHVITKPARAWIEFNPEQRQRFQNIVFPSGLAFSRTTGLGTPIIATIFKYLKGVSAKKEELAPQVGLEPTTLRLTAGCSAIELLRSRADREG